MTDNEVVKFLEGYDILNEDTYIFAAKSSLLSTEYKKFGIYLCKKRRMIENKLYISLIIYGTIGDQDGNNNNIFIIKRYGDSGLDCEIWENFCEYKTILDTAHNAFDEKFRYFEGVLYNNEYTSSDIGLKIFRDTFFYLNQSGDNNDMYHESGKKDKGVFIAKMYLLVNSMKGLKNKFKETFQ